LLVTALILLLPAQLPPGAADDFPKKLQEAALAATVRVVRPLAAETGGSGVIVGRRGGFVYVLTADHLVGSGQGVDVHTFSLDPHPQLAAVYKSATVIARTKDTSSDLAVLRLATSDKVPGVIPICPPEKMPRDTSFPVLTAGCTGGKPPTCLVDRVAGKKLVRLPGAMGAAHFWEVGRKQAGGRSGGLLINKQGLLLGICSGVSGNAGYFCHIEEVHQFLKSNALGWLFEEAPATGEPTR
jgi:hypothetical protein